MKDMDCHNQPRDRVLQQSCLKSTIYRTGAELAVIAKGQKRGNLLYIILRP